METSFIPAITAPTQFDTACWFAFAGDQLLYQENSRQPIPILDEFAKLGLSAIRQQYLGSYDGVPCFSVEVDKYAKPPTGFTLNGLRFASPHLSSDLFALAGRAVQIVDWDRTHSHQVKA
jgi:NAD+ diphosphatase